MGLLSKYGVELIGAKLPSIDRAEDRELFKQSMKRIGLKVPQSGGVCVGSGASLLPGYATPSSVRWKT